MSDFQLLLRVSGAKLPVVLEALKGAADLLSVLPCEPSAREKPPKRYSGGKRLKGISGPDCVLETLRSAGGSASYARITEDLHAKGFSPSSASPALSELKSRGLVEFEGHGSYKLTELGQHTGGPPV
jgi:hypothetical protein